MKVGLVSGDWVHPSRVPDGREKWGGSGWVRLAQYMELTPFEWVTGTLVWNKDCFVIRKADETYEYVPVIYMHRLMHTGLADHMKQARANGQIILNDIDDWYWGLDTTNAAFMATDPRFNKVENRDNYREILASSDLVTISTPYLASRLDWVRCPKTIIKNTVDVGRFTPHQHHDGEVTLGWVGSTAHRSRDLETVASVLRTLHTNGEVRLHHSGHHDTHPSFASRVGLPDSVVSTLPLSGHEDYPDILNFDIGIVPLNVVPFNRAKSDIKGLEYASAGIPFVAQRIDAYQELYDSLGVGRLAKNSADWLKAIRAYKNSPSMRAEDAEKNRQAIWQRDIHLGAAAVTELLSSFF